MKIFLTIISAMVLLVFNCQAQWSTQVQLSDLNSWSAQPGFFGWYNTSSNAPVNQVYGNGIQLTLPQDSRFGAQIVIPTWDNQIYYRRNVAGAWDPWYKLWSSANFDPDQYLDRSLPSIRGANSSNTFINGYTFAYATSGTPWNGSLISFGGLGGDYDTQINSDYGPDGGKHISFRTRMGDFNYWNNWYELYHSGNINKSDVDFAAKDVNCTNLYSGGNIWAKQIKVAVTNPWGDYVFNSSYRLRSLEELKTYIKKYHRLPEMPTARIIEKDGIDVGQLNTLLTKKVEELTLYLIEKDKKDTQQQMQIKKQSALLKVIAKRLSTIETQIKK